jgi:hypothetical protein
VHRRLFTHVGKGTVNMKVRGFSLLTYTSQNTLLEFLKEDDKLQTPKSIDGCLIFFPAKIIYQETIRELLCLYILRV